MATPPEESASPAPAEEAEKPQEYQYPGGWTIPFYFTLRFLIRVIGTFWFRLSIKGMENIPKSGPVLLVSNHGSHLDPPLVSTVCPRRVAYLAKSELFEQGPLFTLLIRSLGAFPIKRGGGDRAALRTSIALLRNGYPLLMFPEGNRSRDGSIGEAKTGVAMLLAQVPEAAIVPIRIDGSFQAMPPGKSFPRPAKIRITVGKAFYLSDLKGLPTVKKQLYQEIGREIMNRISAA